MSENVTIKPDLKFVKDVIASGGADLKKCYQCSTCTVVCNVTPNKGPFPRKEMLYAQWGLKEKLMGSPDVWLCHQCSDCTAYCPRGAKPGEVLGAIRKMVIRENSAPSFLADMVGKPGALPVLFAIPAIIFFLIVSSLGTLDVFSKGGEIVYAKFIPVPFIDTVFIAAALFAVVSFFFGVRKYWTGMTQASGISKYAMMARGNIFESIKDTVMDILAHRKFEKCDVAKGRTQAHRFVFFAFAGLAVTTTWAIVYLYGYELAGIKAFAIFHFGESPYPLYDPMKILGNASAIALLIGITKVITNRMEIKDKAGAGSYFDWLFISIIVGIVATGILSEVLRLSGVAAVAYPTYFVHLMFVFFLFAYAPFSKMAHMVYRATAMVFAKHTQREGN